MRCMFIFLLSLLAFTAVADDLLWGRLQRDPNMVVLMRNAESSGNNGGANMLVWDASGSCAGEKDWRRFCEAWHQAGGNQFAHVSMQ